ncbi:MAG: hypothetical protein F6K41_33550, partial [Symploca sp. SIO3E6]|nr:hypothetical protein [Caldora sp. SIO3E6]
AQMGVLYYAIYNPLRKRKPRLEVYQLEAGEYQLLEGEPVWLAQINLGIGREQGTYQGATREWLYWYDEQGKRYLTPEETISDTQQQLEQERQRTKRLAQLLREAGVDPDEN